MNLTIAIHDGLNSEACAQIREAINTHGEDCVELHITIIKAYARYFGFDLTQKLNKWQFARCMFLFCDEMGINLLYDRLNPNLTLSAQIKSMVNRMTFDGLCNLLELLIEPYDVDSNPCVSNDDIVKRWNYLDLRIYYEVYHDSVSSLELCVIVFRDYASILGIDLFSKDITLKEVNVCLRAMCVDRCAFQKGKCYSVKGLPSIPWNFLELIVKHVEDCSRDMKEKSFHLFRDDSEVVQSPNFKNFEVKVRQERKKRGLDFTKTIELSHSCNNTQHSGHSVSEIHETAAMVCSQTKERRDYQCLPSLVDPGKVERCQDVLNVNVDDGVVAKASTKAQLMLPPVRVRGLRQIPFTYNKYKPIHCCETKPKDTV
mmetsp:Transcript_49995/g.64045  ORF Transcript_49995/g.64045 Transcript_49995/m.64045 type:complete len:372 (+) Transcript_49995:115-1230(+)